MKKTVFALFAAITFLVPSLAAAGNVVPVPEPSIAALLLVGGVGAGASIVRRLRSR